ncbi:MAG TPA: TIGR00341 family protein [Caldithrix abyssi]|uniref:TIGR00341 family protein n=1 Tax=Caldithrix abyssi TaxID=187145 RepID=A0A7V1LPQ6_CALAY|nr:TIGR00341 family protein [Caldithrix abyssi]
MSERVIKIILPREHAKEALALLEEREKLNYWQEERSSKNFVVSILLDSVQSEAIMDLFEKKFSKTAGFRLILFPVEASLPRPKEKKKKTGPGDEKKEQARLRISREELFSDVVESTKLNNVFILMTVLSTVVVAIGLLNNNVAVIIGAMVIAPFLGPNVALALSSVLAEKKLGMDAMKTLIAGGAIVVFLAAAMGLLLDVDPGVAEISSRTGIGFADIILALASGAAGVLAFTTGASAAVIGVMVAVALLPPLTVFGLMVGSGEYELATGAFLLFSANIICVNLAGIGTFLFQGVSPRTWYAADKAKKAIRKSLVLWIVTLALLAAVIFLWSR